MNELIQAAILGVVEGITELLPISSTGHLLVSNRILGESALFDGWFIVAIQFGAVIALLLHHAKELLEMFRFRAEHFHFWRAMAISITPTFLVGFIWGNVIERLSFNGGNRLAYVAIALILGGVVMLAVERRLPPPVQMQSASYPLLSMKSALFIGMCQVLAFVPGVSRSAACIFGGLTAGLNRQEATRYSFFLAIPTITGAAIYSTWRNFENISSKEIDAVVLGILVATVVAWACTRWLLRYVSTHRFTPFAWYRLGAGSLILLLHWQGFF